MDRYLRFSNDVQLNQPQWVKLCVSMAKFDRSQFGKRQSKVKPDSNEAKVQAGRSLDRCVSAQNIFYKQRTDKQLFRDLCVRLNECDTCIRSLNFVNSFGEIQVVCQMCHEIYRVFEEYYPPKSGTYKVDIIGDVKECRICWIRQAVQRKSDTWCDDCYEIALQYMANDPGRRL